jgi:hypothetical protein
VSPLPVPQPTRVQAPARAGVGLRFRPRFPFRSWPADWWQRNYDLPIVDPDGPAPLPLTSRQMRVPPPGASS